MSFLDDHPELLAAPRTGRRGRPRVQKVNEIPTFVHEVYYEASKLGPARGTMAKAIRMIAVRRLRARGVEPAKAPADLARMVAAVKKAAQRYPFLRTSKNKHAVLAELADHQRRALGLPKDVLDVMDEMSWLQADELIHALGVDGTAPDALLNAFRYGDMSGFPREYLDKIDLPVARYFVARYVDRVDPAVPTPDWLAIILARLI